MAGLRFNAYLSRPRSGGQPEPFLSKERCPGSRVSLMEVVEQNWEAGL